MSEELWEQVAYGDHCIHGTAIGTPGGADLMCGFCESGLTRWVDDRSYNLWAIFIDPTTGGETPLMIGRRTAWFESDLDDPSLLLQIYRYVRNAQRAFEPSGFEVYFEARLAGYGYWTDPSEEE